MTNRISEPMLLLGAWLAGLFRTLLPWLALGALAGCGHTGPPNILLIVVDTLRADRVDWYGGHRELTPFLDSLAARSNVFWNAYAQSSWTSPSVASLMTSRYQSQHNITQFTSALADEEVTLAEVLKQHGYATGGFSANILLRSGLGYERGFDRYSVYRPENAKFTASDLNRESLAWLDSLRSSQGPPRPTFLYLQYIETHPPLLPPEDALRTIVARAGAEARLPALHELTRGPTLFGRTLKLYWLPPSRVADFSLLYDAEVLSLDAAMRGFFAELEQRGFLDNAIIVVTADHGEEIFDHQRLGHGQSLYNELIHVPLLIRAPHQRERSEIHSVVSLIDVAPTLLSFAGIAPPERFEGQSLRDQMTEGGLAGGSALSGRSPFRDRPATAR